MCDRLPAVSHDLPAISYDLHVGRGKGHARSGLLLGSLTAPATVMRVGPPCDCARVCVCAFTTFWRNRLNLAAQDARARRHQDGAADGTRVAASPV